ncbi:MAG: NifU family protein [Syntrophobacteraceae bacterium]|jgi:Fe-S cluster biogenesis protein NfuA
MHRTIEKVIETEIRPRLQAHDGDIELLGVSDDGTVRIRLIGQCATCPASHLTTENLIKAVLKQKVSGVTEISVTQSVSDELIRDALRFLRKGVRPG